MMVDGGSPNIQIGYGYTATLIVPTGVGASIGGYAGDAMPVSVIYAGFDCHRAYTTDAHQG